MDSPALFLLLEKLLSVFPLSTMLSMCSPCAPFMWLRGDPPNLAFHWLLRTQTMLHLKDGTMWICIDYNFFWRQSTLSVNVDLINVVNSVFQICIGLFCLLNLLITDIRVFKSPNKIVNVSISPGISVIFDALVSGVNILRNFTSSLQNDLFHISNSVIIPNYYHCSKSPCLNSTQLPNFFCLVSAWRFSLHFFTFNLPISLYLKWFFNK